MGSPLPYRLQREARAPAGPHRTPCRNERLGFKLWEQGIGSGQIVLLTPGEMKAGRIAERIDGGVDFRAQPSARASDGLILTPLFTCSRAVLVGAHDGGVDHRVFVVR